MNESETARHAAKRLEKWLARNHPTKPLAVILGGSCNGLSFVRSLGRRGIPTLLLDSEPLLGMYTRYGRVALLPPADRFPQEWVTFLQLVGSRLAAPAVLIATSDLHSLLVSRHRETLQRYFRFLVPDHQTLEQIVNKRSQYEIARAAGIPIPTVHFPESLEQANHFAASMTYPCILKPYNSLAKAKLARQKLVVVHSSAELVAAYERITAIDVPLMIQELIPGDDTALFGYLGFWDRDGRELGWVTKQKLRQYPPLFGDGSLQVTVNAPQLAELSRRLLRYFNYRGFVGVEFKFDARDQTYRLMEINPRTVSGNQLAISAGVDFPWLGYQYLTGVKLETMPATSFRSHVKWINEEGDIQAFWVLRRSRAITLASWLHSLRGVTAKALWAWDDPRPLLTGLSRFFGLLFARLWDIIPGWKAGTQTLPCSDHACSKPIP